MKKSNFFYHFECHRMHFNRYTIYYTYSFDEYIKLNLLIRFEYSLFISESGSEKSLSISNSTESSFTGGIECIINADRSRNGRLNSRGFSPKIRRFSRANSKRRIGVTRESSKRTR